VGDDDGGKQQHNNMRNEGDGVWGLEDEVMVCFLVGWAGGVVFDDLFWGGALFLLACIGTRGFVID